MVYGQLSSKSQTVNTTICQLCSHAWSPICLEVDICDRAGQNHHRISLR